MKGTIDNTTLWNEAAKAGAAFGAVSIGCLMGKELSALSGSTFLVTAAAVILWVVEFFGCILLMKNLMLRLTEKYQGVKMEDTYRFGRRVALLSGLILASVDAFVTLKLPQETLESFVTEVNNTLSAKMGSGYEGDVGRFVDNLPLYTFIFQWLYCFLYGSLLSGIMSRYIVLQGPFQGGDDGEYNIDNH